MPNFNINKYEPDPEELARVRRENSPEGLADFFGDQAMITYHEVRKQPARPGSQRGHRAGHVGVVDRDVLGATREVRAPGLTAR
jgi:hypothetical protein